MKNMNETEMVCKRCGSTDVVKAGIQRGKHSASQIYRCNSCKRKFNIRLIEKSQRRLIEFEPELVDNLK